MVVYLLTNLANRNQFLEDINTRIHPIVILSNINAYYGINVGDIVLQQIAKVYSTIASEYNLKVYRMHSDEFAFLLDKQLSHSELEDILFYVTRRILEYRFGTKELLENADIALKFAKTSNENHAYYEDAKSLVKTFENNLLMTHKIAGSINVFQS